MSPERTKYWFLLFLSTGAFVFGVVNYRDTSVSNPSRGNSNLDEELRHAISSLESQVTRVEKEIDFHDLSLLYWAPNKVAKSASGRTEVTSQTLSKLEAKLARILKSGAAQRKNASVGSNWTYWKFRRDKVLDESLPLSRRVLHLGYLRGNTIAFDGPVVEFVTKVVLSPENVACRVNVVRDIKGIDHPAFKALLLKALCSDVDSKVREEAAESLSFFIRDLEVVDSLKTAISKDVSIAVKAQAQKSLGEGR